MAIAGGMTTAYKCRVHEYVAMAILERGEACIVASADIPQLRQRLAGLGVG